MGLLGAVVFALVLTDASAALAGDDGVWQVRKSSGEVWISATGAQPATLKREDALKPGDTIRTGRNGRVLLARGEESILISPNSVIGIPQEKKDGLATTILQQAGSILLDVEKKSVKHFEVETPYLAAVVKGTQFIVTVGDKSTSVDVKRGQVEVSDFRTGQIAQVMPGQAATTSANGRPGLVLSGSGTFNPIEQGKPRTPSVSPIMVPKGGLTAPQRAQTGGARQSAAANPIRPTAAVATHLPGGQKTGGLRISTALGEVKLNFHKVTNGLAHGTTPPIANGRGAASAAHDNTSVWSGGQSGASALASTATSQGSPGNGGGTASGASGAGSSGAPPSSVVGPAVISVADAPDTPGKGPGGGPGKKGGGGAANAAGGHGSGGNGPPGHGPPGNGPPGPGEGNGNGGANGHGPGGNGPPGHGH
ncbi:FecR family protein [uncultured Bradyrhizobium sp.]|jgi:hypothetical protein|uniref:FecR family protein n=1 Tax=uncultured Bradyrhizobium sp. TaxID=199684 RepID=UPI002631068B|nr:FecR family protein [uncultured Bradyrhizobium sp.]